MARAPSTQAHRLIKAILPPWTGFVVAFMYYVALSMAVFGNVAMPETLFALAYVLPFAAYAALLVARGVRVVTSVPVELVEAPRALIG